MIEALTIAAFAVLAIILSVSLYFNYKHGVLLINIIDQIEDALQIMDEKERSISDVLQVPLFYDSPQIRQVHDDLTECRDSILLIASSLGRIDNEEEIVE